MRMSDVVTEYILRVLAEGGGNAEIQRNVLAGELGCVPSQINYVLTSRFTPEQGYLVESKRGGGGYIRITRVKVDRSSAIMHLVNSIGDKLDGITAHAMLNNLQQWGAIRAEDARLMAAALSDKAYSAVPVEGRDKLRAAVFKNMLVTLVQAG
ncbi:MAG TPA: CtsR family transcriptional regulator [Candidatus Gallacutalibacter stercoravium]|nr:CtsR family transcriptional regulator [Candidatus Gallacutalibacter stercoravium]